MKRRTKASQKRLNNLLIILLLVAVFLIMSTYAWFTANRTVKIDNIQVHIETSSGLQISADAVEWKSVLDYEDIKSAYQGYTTQVNQLPQNVEPVSSILTNGEDGHLEMFHGIVTTDLDSAHQETYGKYLLQAVKETDTASYSSSGDYTDSGHYLAFDIFLKDTVKVDNLYFGGTVSEKNVIKGIENAARVAFIKGGTYEDVDASDEIQQLSTAGGKVLLWEPNDDQHTAKAKAYADSLGWSYDVTPIEYSGVAKAFSGIELSKATEDDDAEAGNFKKINESNTGAKIYSTTKSQIVSIPVEGGLDAGATKFRFYLWIEGQDIDCENNASGTDLDFNFKFSLDQITSNT